VEHVNCATQDIQDSQDGLEQLAEEVKTTQEKIREITTVKEDIQRKQSTLNSRSATATGLARIIQQIEEQIRKAETPEGDEGDSEQDRQKYETERQSAENKRESLRSKKAIFNIASELLKDSGIKSRIIRQYVPVINRLINKYLAAMEFYVQFELDETFKELIKSRYRDDFSYASFSEGEKMRIDLALLFTWRAIARLKNSASTNLLIMDEVMDSSLDQSGTDEFLKIISDLTLDANTFIISHKTDQLLDKFNHVIRFEKKKNFSMMIV
jgi:DNA repair exonuclease SbcCD ATPase subunit